MFAKIVRKILSINNLSIKVPSIKIELQPTLLNMPQELYGDAGFFVSQETKTTDPSIKLRYRRAALMCFCASTEAWINAELRNYISKKETGTRTVYEQKVINFIEQPTATMPQNYFGIKVRLYRCVGEIFTGQFLDSNNNTLDAFEKFIELSEARNTIVHYTTKNREIVYDQYFGVPPLGITKSVKDAPKIIFDLYHAIHSLNNTFTIPSWIAPA